MRIAILASPTNFHTQKWAQGLLRAGAKVYVFSFESGKIPGTTCVQLTPSFTFRGNFTYLSYIYGGYQLRQALVAHQIDLLNPINITPFGVWGKQSGFRPMVSLAMGADILEYPPRLGDRDIPLDRIYDSHRLTLPGKANQWLYSLKWRYFRRHIHAALHHSDYVLGDNLQLTQAVANWFDMPPERVQLNRWGIEPALFQSSTDLIHRLRQRYGLREGEALILSPRGLKPVYQGDVILQGFAQLLAQGFTHAKLMVLSAGYGVPASLDQQASALMDQYPTFIYEPDLITREEMAALWTLTDAFVVAPVYDGYSNALSEGRYIGAVPFVNDIPAHQEIMQPETHGIFVHPFSAAHLATAIRTYWSEHSERHVSMAQANRRWIMENALFEANMKAFVSLAEKVTARPLPDTSPHVAP